MKEKYNVLIVSKQEELIYSIEKLLKPEAYTVTAAQSGLEAYEKIKEAKYHIVLLDIDISDLDGIELLKLIKNYDALTQVITMTENSTMDKILSALEYGANDYVDNPGLQPDKVIKIIDYTIDKLERWRNAILEIVR